MRQIDLGGKTVVPGFIDAHSHPCYAGIRHLRWVDCDLRSIADIQNAIRARAAKTPAGEWIIGFKYDDTKTKEGRKLTREDLDAATKDHPVFIEHRSRQCAPNRSRISRLRFLLQAACQIAVSFMDLPLEKGLGTSSQSFDARLSVTGTPVGPPHKRLVVATAFGFVFITSRSMDA